jgi:hypothetical protein
MYDDDDLYVTEICDIDFEFKYIERWQKPNHYSNNSRRMPS